MEGWKMIFRISTIGMIFRFHVCWFSRVLHHWKPDTPWKMNGDWNEPAFQTSMEDMLPAVNLQGCKKNCHFLRELPFPRPIILGIYVSFWVCKWMKQIQAMENWHGNGKPTMNEDVLPIEIGDFPMSCLFPAGYCKWINEKKGPV